jgi:hypothetical protein
MKHQNLDQKQQAEWSFSSLHEPDTAFVAIIYHSLTLGLGRCLFGTTVGDD